MVRVTYGAPRRRKKLRYFKAARGYRGGRSKLWRTVREALMRSWAYAYRDRKQRKRQFRRLWILRINAAARQRGTNYSRLMAGLKRAGVELNRKQLSELAVNDPAAFDALAEEAKSALV
ncbi:MAG: 50S ribosomal protein L20 [Planctomycetota bacterium]|jgi:large subunit ribosomal protein L20|nr:50S ribosomal protein L20 [Planctomycetota bacterium]MDP6761417.1 50S ribosomal protein L20 [Planctomycetota bacterium]